MALHSLIRLPKSINLPPTWVKVWKSSAYLQSVLHLPCRVYHAFHSARRHNYSHLLEQARHQVGSQQLVPPVCPAKESRQEIIRKHILRQSHNTPDPRSHIWKYTGVEERFALFEIGRTVCVQRLDTNCVDDGVEFLASTVGSGKVLLSYYLS